MKRISLCLLAAVALAAVLTACGSSSTTSSGGAASSASGTASGGAAGGSANRTKLAACLKAHGVTLPARPGGGQRPPGGYGGGGPGFFGGGGGGAPGSGANRPGFRSNPKFQAAVKACGGGFPTRRPGGAPQRAAIQSFVTCVGQHGYKLPQPNFSGHGAIFPAKIASDPKFRAASKSCLSLLRPQGGAGGGAPASAGGGAPST
jgi:hypothetical protein